MPDQRYKPVRESAKQAIAKAKSRPGFSQAWDALEEEYAALDALLSARKMAGLTQEALGSKMGTTKRAISRPLIAVTVVLTLLPAPVPASVYGV
jgi:hypothetical protein